MRARTGPGFNPYHDQHELRDPAWSFRHYDLVTYPDTDPHDVARAIESVVPDLCLFVRGTTLTERVWDGTRRNPDRASTWFNTHWFEQEVYQQDGAPDRQGWANGVVWTSWRQLDVAQEPALHISVGLYDQPCADRACVAGHMNDPRRPIDYRAAPAVADWQLDAIEEEIGVHPAYRLARRAVGHNRDVLASLGFLPLDAPLAGERVGLERVYRALDYLAREDRNNLTRLAERFFTAEEQDAPALQLLCATGAGTFSYKLGELLRQGYPLDVRRVEQLLRARALG